MKRFTTISGAALVLLFTLPFTALADTTPVPIHLTVVTNDATLFDGDISVSECLDSEIGTTTSVNSLCAVQQTASTSGWTTDLIWYSFGPFLNGINSYTSDFATGKSWSYYTDGVSGMTSIAAHILHPGEKLLFTYAISPLRIVVASSSPKVGTTTLLQAQYFDSANTYDWVNATETTFMVDGVAIISDSSGLLRYIPTSNTPVSVTAEKAGFVMSAPVTLSPYTTSSTLIHLRIETNAETLYDADISVEACADTETGTTTSINGLCAVQQAAAEKGFPVGLVWYSFGPFVDSIGTYVSDSVNYVYWSYYIDRVDAAVGASAHLLVPGEELLFTYHVDPLRIITPTQSPMVGTPVVLSGQYFDSASYKWASATLATFTVNGIATSSDADGLFTIITTDTNPIVITLSRLGLIASPTLTLTPVAESAPTPVVGSATPNTPHTIDTQKAVLFLRTLQNPDGSYGAVLYTDWVSIGLSGVNGAEDIREKLASYLKRNTNPGVFLTDIERRAMALMALGIDPSTGTDVDYIKAMVEYYDGRQWGDKDEVNDDMFALIPLLHVGYTTNDEMIIQTIATILSAQQSNGSWGSIDLTAAGIQALAPVSPYPGVSEAILRAKAYLHIAQELDGGFDSSFATSWVLQAIAGEDLGIHWTKNGRTPQDYLWLLQQADGGIESTALDQNSRIWATAYAIPAANGKDWNALLGNFPRSALSKPSSLLNNPGASSGEVLGTTTLAIATSTAITFVATSSSLSVTAASGTPLFASSSEKTTFATTTLGTTTLATTTLEKPVIIKKVVTKKPPLPIEAPAPLALATTTVVEVPKQLPWTSVITRPFVRLYQAVSSWFN